jgi:hypothetical protein
MDAGTELRHAVVMLRLACSIIVGSLALLSCTKQTTSEPHVPARPKPAVYTLRCQLFYYPLGAETASEPPQQVQQQTLTVEGDGQGAITLAGLRLYASYAIGQAHHSGVKLELTADGAMLLGQTYELPEAMPPTDLGGGFTGFVSFYRPGHQGDHQYSCALLPAASP